MKNFNFKNIFYLNQAGMSLLEISIVMIIMSVVSVSMSSMFVHMFQNQAKLTNKNSFLDLENEVKRIISSAPNCGIDLLNNEQKISVKNWNVATEYDIPKIKSLYTEFNDNANYDNLNLNSIKISGYFDRSDNTIKYVGADTGDTSVDQNIYASLKMNIDATVGSTIKTTSMINVPVTLVLSDDKSEIVSCIPQALSEDVTLMCSSLGGEWDSELNLCSLPCSEGFIKSDDGSKCELLADDDGEEDLKMCNNLESCEVMDRFRGNNYK